MSASTNGLHSVFLDGFGLAVFETSVGILRLPQLRARRPRVRRWCGSVAFDAASSRRSAVALLHLCQLPAHDVEKSSAVILVSNLHLEHIKVQSSRHHCEIVFTSGVLFLFGAAGGAFFLCPRRRMVCNRCSWTGSAWQFTRHPCRSVFTSGAFVLL